MKKHLIKPGFELIFALSLITIIGLPPLVFGQSTKDMEIKITNGDTVVNGKNIKDLSPAEHKQALTDINNLGSALTPGQKHLLLRKFDRDTTRKRVIIEDRNFHFGDKDPMMTDGQTFGNDSTKRVFRFRMKGPNGKDSAFAFNYRLQDDRRKMLDDRGPDEFFHPRGSGRSFMHHRNVQIFDYSNTGNDGIDTHISFRVNEPMPEKTKEITGSEKADLQLTDLNIVPEFSSGKTVLMFSLPARAMAEVKLTDNEGKTIWADKALNGSFNKKFMLGLNGVYYLQVKQAGKVALKRIVKE